MSFIRTEPVPKKIFKKKNKNSKFEKDIHFKSEFFFFEKFKSEFNLE